MILESNCWSIFVISIIGENECIVYARKAQNLIIENKPSLPEEKPGKKNTKIPSSQHILRKKTPKNVMIFFKWKNVEHKLHGTYYM